MSEQDRNLAEMDAADLNRHQSNQALIQEAIDAVALTAQGRSKEGVQVTLVEALAARGIVDQPELWLDAVVTELVSGSRYIEDPAAAPVVEEDNRESERRPR